MSISRRKKIMFVVVSIVVTSIALGAIAIKLNISAKDKKAVQIAQEYLSQKYTQEMRYSSVRFSWIDPAIYHVTFSPVNNPDLFFEVIVQQNLTIAEGLHEFEKPTCPDDYYLSFFSSYTSKQIQNEVQKIWSENARTVIPIDDPALYSHRVPVELNEQMTAEEMEPFFTYDVYITTNMLLDVNSKNEEMKKILELIQYIQTSKYRPREILFWYQTGESDKGKEIKKSVVFGDGNDYYHVGRLENWAEITSIEDVEKIMNEQWFSK